MGRFTEERDSVRKRRELWRIEEEKKGKKEFLDQEIEFIFHIYAELSSGYNALYSGGSKHIFSKNVSSSSPGSKTGQTINQHEAHSKHSRTTRRPIPQDRSHHSHRCETPKSNVCTVYDKKKRYPCNRLWRPIRL
jgi:hypothetical protein